MEVIERAVRDRGVAFAERDMVARMPLEHDTPGGDVDLLHDRFDQRPGGRPADAGEIERHRLVRRQQCRVSRGELEFVQVTLQPVACLHPRDFVVPLVHDHVLTEAVPVRDLPLPPREHRALPVGLSAKVQHALVGERQEPDHLTPVVDDQRPGLAASRLAGDEHVTRRGAHSGRHDLHVGWSEIGTGPEGRGGRAGRRRSGEPLGACVARDRGRGEPRSRHRQEPPPGPALRDRVTRFSVGLAHVRPRFRR